MDQGAWGWVRLAQEALAGVTLADNLRGFVDIPPNQGALTFRVRIPVFAAGTVTVRLRFGMQDADAGLITAQGIDFVALGAVNASDLRSVNWGGAAPAPGGTSPGIMPPRVAVFLTTAAGTTLTYELVCACIMNTG